MEQNEITLEGIDRSMTGSSINITNTNEVDEKHCRDIVISIKEMWKRVPHRTDADCSIYRVPKRLCNMNSKAYTPQVISIGPFHHYNQSNFIDTKQHKLQALYRYLRRVNRTLEDIVGITQKWENKARSCYGEPIEMDKDKFVTMLLLDGCFIVDFLTIDRLCFCSRAQNGVDTSFYEAMGSDIYRDLIMLENQLPFFVLQGLFDLIPPEENFNFSLIEHTETLFKKRSMKTYKLPRDVCPQNAMHLVDLLRLYFFPQRVTKQHKTESNQRLIPPSVTELREAGVTIKKAKEVKCLMDISFKNGVLEIPPLDIDDHFETIVRNLMAFEHYPAACCQRYTIQYISFLDYLIRTEKDVRLLVEAGIIINNIGGSDEISRLFNDLCKYVTIPGGYCYLDHIIKALSEHCNRRKNRWMASLKHNYFNTPWAVISFFAATFLILLTLIQTIFTGISTFK